MKTFLAILPIVPLFPTVAIAEPYRHIDKTIHHLPDERRVIIERIPAINLPAPLAPAARPVPEPKTAARLAQLAANPPQPRDIHFRVSRLSREQAAAWHRHAVERKGGAR